MAKRGWPKPEEKKINAGPIIRKLLKMKGIKQDEMANYFGLHPVSFRNKLKRDSFTLDQLWLALKYMGYDLAIIDKNKNVVSIFDNMESDIIISTTGNEDLSGFKDQLLGEVTTINKNLETLIRLLTIDD